MTLWSSRDRFSAALAGEQPDRPPVAAWRQFTESEHGSAALAAAHIAFQDRWQWDWIKVNPRLTLAPEAWGNTYDPGDYNDVEPRLVRHAIVIPADVRAVAAREPDPAPLREQADAIRAIRAAHPDAPLLATVTSPLTVLLQLAGLPVYPGARVYGSVEPISLSNLLGTNPGVVRRALEAIAQHLAAHVAELLAAGADGLFYPVTGTPALLRSEAAFRSLSEQPDRTVLEAASGHARILHTCGPRSHPEWFAGYPVDAVHWDQHAPGNPGLGADTVAVEVGGVDHVLLATGTPQQVEVGTRAALRTATGAAGAGAARGEAGRRRGGFLLAPSCSVPIVTPDANLAALRRGAIGPEPDAAGPETEPDAAGWEAVGVAEGFGGRAGAWVTRPTGAAGTSQPLGAAGPTHPTAAAGTTYPTAAAALFYRLAAQGLTGGELWD